MANGRSGRGQVGQHSGIEDREQEVEQQIRPGEDVRLSCPMLATKIVSFS